jgi:hypothetical protein
MQPILTALYNDFGLTAMLLPKRKVALFATLNLKLRIILTHE